MATPFFSLIVPVYNTPEPYMKTCFESLKEQTFGDFEVLLIDDGSREECAAFLKTESETDPRFRLFRQENAGISVARNKGIENARGAWILFLDADDWMEGNACERLHGYLENTDADMLVFNGVEEYLSGPTKIVYRLEPGKCYDFSEIDIREMLYRQLLLPSNKGGGLCFCWDKAYRRSFLNKNGLWFTPGIRKSEDKLFNMHCCRKLGKLLYVEEVLYHYRIHSESLVHRYSATVDHDRATLIIHLEPTVKAMGEELSVLKGIPYTKLEWDFDMYCFAIILDVLKQKYYHPDNPDKKTRRRDALAFLRRSPFKEVFSRLPYRKLTARTKLKKFMLSAGLVSTYSFVRAWKESRVRDRSLNWFSKK